MPKKLEEALRYLAAFHSAKRKEYERLKRLFDFYMEKKRHLDQLPPEKRKIAEEKISKALDFITKKADALRRSLERMSRIGITEEDGAKIYSVEVKIKGKPYRLTVRIKGEELLLALSNSKGAIEEFVQVNLRTGMIKAKEK